MATALLHLAVGTGITSFDVYENGTYKARITKQYTGSDWAGVGVDSASNVTVTNVQYATGYSGLHWHYNASGSTAPSLSSYGYKSPYFDYTITATFARYCYMSADNYSAPTTTYSATVQFSANGGYGAPASISGTTTNSNQYVTLTIPSTTPTRSGYAFLGWSMTQGATSASYYPGGTITVYGTTAGNVYTLYAVWQQSVTTYYATVSFSANGGSGAPSAISGSSTAGSSITLTIPATVPTRTGYEFLGWSTSASATAASYLPGGAITVTGTTSGASYTLYAVWRKKDTGGYVWIYTGAWEQYMVWVYTGAWERCTPWTYNGTWAKTIGG